MTFDNLSLERKRQIDTVCSEFEESRNDEAPAPLSAFVEQTPFELREHVLRELLAIDFEMRLTDGQEISVERYRRDFPEHGDLVSEVYDEVMTTLAAGASDPALVATESQRRIGDFRIVREIGRGGMGLVFEAVQESLKRNVALKVLPHNPLLHDHGAKRFQRESHAIARLHHSHIVDVFGSGEQEGVLYFAMRLIDGTGLNHVIEQLRSPQPPATTPTEPNLEISRRFATALADETRLLGEISPIGPMSPIEPADVTDDARAVGLRLNDQDRCTLAARIGQQMAEALHYAHGEGVLHRDVKPSNIMLDARGQAWLTDFGLAKLIQEEVTENLTQQGDVVGTLRYMAPETLHGQADGRSDVYSLGVTLFELLTLRPPFEMFSREELLNHRLTAESPRLDAVLPGLPRDLVTVIQKAIEREPAARYQTAGELADDLRRFLDDEPIRARRVSVWERFTRWARRNKALAWSLMTTMTLLVIGLVVASLSAAHFQKLEAKQRTLVTEKGTLAENNGALAEKNGVLAAHNLTLADEAQAERKKATLLVADVFTKQGLQAVDEGRDREALLWFAQAAVKSESLDAERTRKSLVRYRRLSTQMARPVAVLEKCRDIDRLIIHPSHRYVLGRPYRGFPPALWDLTTSQPVVLPESAQRATILAWSADGQWLAVGGESQVTLLPFPECVESFNRKPQASASSDPAASAQEAGSARRPNVATLARAWDEPPISPRSGERGYEKGHEPHVISAPSGAVLRLEFDASGRFLALSTDKVARVWDLEAKDFVCPPLVHEHPIAGLVMSPDRRWLATFGEDARCHIFRLGESGHAPTLNSTAVLSAPHRHLGFNLAAYFTPKFVRQGNGVLTCASLGSIQVWNLESSQPEQPFVVQAAGDLRSVESLSNDEIFVGGTIGHMIVSVAAPNAVQSQFTLANSRGENMTAAYDAAGDRLFVGFSDGDSELWAVRERRPLISSASVTNGSSKSSFSADGRMLATTQFNHEGIIWELPPLNSFNRTPQARALSEPASQSREDAHASGLRLNEDAHASGLRLNDDRGDLAVSFDESIHQAAFSADSQYLAVTSFHKNASVYHLPTGQRVATLPTPARSQFIAVLQPYFLADSEQLLVDVRLTNPLRQLAIWNWRTGEQRQALEMPSTSSESSYFFPQLQQTADKRHLLAPGDKGSAWLLDLQASGEITPQHIHGPALIDWLGISPDGRILTGRTNFQGQTCGVLYNVATSTRGEPLPHQNSLHSVRFSSDMKRLATCSWDYTVKVWEPSTQKLLVGPLRHSAAVYDAEFSPDNRYLLTFAKDASVSVWDLSTGQLAAAPFTGAVDVAAAFRPGHDQVVIVDFAGWLHIWDWRNSTRLWPAMRLFAKPDAIWSRFRSLTLSPDGRYAAIGGHGALQVIDLTPLDDKALDAPAANDLLTEAELFSGQRLLPNGEPVKLTPEEWQARFTKRGSHSQMP